MLLLLRQQSCRHTFSPVIAWSKSFSSSTRWLGPKKSKKGGNSSSAADPPKLLGRPSNNLKGGIVGLANVGKSTFFQALTNSDLGNPANYPFATIDPEEAKVIVPSKRFEKLCEIYRPSQTEVPATLTVFDIAGLTKGASKGDGLGNSFLSHIRAVDGLFQVVRAFDDPEIIHIEGNVDPVRDLQIIFDELILKDMEFTLKHLEVAERYMKKSPPNKAKEYQREVNTAKRVLEHLENNKRVVNGEWKDDDIDVINSMKLLTAKPSVYLVNVSEEDYITGTENERLKDIKRWVESNSPGDVVLPLSVSLEERLTILDTEEERQEELKSLSVTSGLPTAIKELRKSLRLISFFTCGPKEVREWTIRQGVKAPEAAGVIHNDLQKTFIQAQVYKYEDTVEFNGDESALKSNGKILHKGKDYVIEDGDVILFKAGAAKS